MTLQELEHAEQVALFAILGLVGRLDGGVSDDEAELFERIASELGEERLQAVRDEAAKLDTPQAIWDAVARVERTEAREVIYELVYDMAVQGMIVNAESDLLDRLADLWGLVPRAGA